ncbi:MAG: hypothetical protein LQ343_007026 [Gyalolechia ehrenbergii]|nr:MAG: hypothetical protein LQ343_007026 [Gyalolechia ehrenbergii]
MGHVRFDFCDMEDIRPGLLKCAIGSYGAGTISTHLDQLRKLGSTLNATECARKNAERLATGYEDLVVVLQEPSDIAEDVPYHKMFQSSTALQFVDASLRLAFKGQRCVENTIILDIRPYRSNRVRMQQEEHENQREDEEAYKGFRGIFSLLSPKVFIVCQCQPCGEQQDFTLNFSSSINTSGRIKAYTQEGKKSIRVASFHPMYFVHTDQDAEPLKRIMREYLFDATFIVAANLLVGRRLLGFGLANLRHCASDGPVARFEPNGIRFTYQWVGKDDMASDNLIQMKALNLTSRVTSHSSQIVNQ